MNFFDRITDGLKLHEILMLTLGSIMFLVMLVLLIIYASQRRSLKQLLIYFAIPVIMLGWSTIQKIKIDDKGLELDKAITQYNNEKTEENKQQVEELVSELKDRDVSDPAVVEKIAVAEFMIGKPDESEQTIQTLPEDKKKDSTITNLLNSIRISEALKKQLQAVQSNPTDSNQVKKLNQLQIQALNLDLKNTQLDSTIRVADKQITDYKRLNPRVDIRRDPALFNRISN